MASSLVALCLDERLKANCLKFGQNIDEKLTIDTQLDEEKESHQLVLRENKSYISTNGFTGRDVNVLYESMYSTRA